MSESPQIMTLEEVAQYLRVSDRTVYDWANKGEIPCGKLGTSWRFKRAEVEQWVDDKLGTGTRRSAEQTVAIREVLSPDRVLLSDAVNKVDALETLIDILAGTPQIRDREELGKEVYRREKLMSTGIGSGIAVPHVRMESVMDIVAAVAVCKHPLEDYESIDGQPVRIIIMVAAGRHQHAQYLRTLALVSGRLKNADVRESVLNAREPIQVYNLLTGSE